MWTVDSDSGDSVIPNSDADDYDEGDEFGNGDMDVDECDMDDNDEPTPWQTIWQY